MSTVSGPILRTPRALIRSLFHHQAPPPQRWRFSARAALCVGVPIVVGWLAGDMAAGLMASIGGYTALYGSGRPYSSRAWLLASIAIAQALAVGVGIAAGDAMWNTVVSIALTAMLATWLCNALQTGSPGAYIIVLACASGTAMRASHLSPLYSATLILSAGAFAWVVQMAGALADPHGPERRAVIAARRAVAAFVSARDDMDEDGARRRAALALQQAWMALVAQQPSHSRGSATVGRLRTLNRELHTLFAEAVAAEPGSNADALRARLDAIDQRLHHLDDVPTTPRDAVPTGRPDALEGINGSIVRRRVAELAWPVVAATERLAYGVLAIAWSRESSTPAAPPLAAVASAQSRLAFAALADDVRAHRTPDVEIQPAVLRIEFDALKQALATMPSTEGH